MTFNSLLMFDIVFVFFLFLVGVTCLVYYLPPSKQTNLSASQCRHARSSSSINGKNSGGSSSSDDENDCNTTNLYSPSSQLPPTSQQHARRLHYHYLHDDFRCKNDHDHQQQYEHDQQNERTPLQQHQRQYHQLTPISDRNFHVYNQQSELQQKRHQQWSKNSIDDHHLRHNSSFQRIHEHHHKYCAKNMKRLNNYNGNVKYFVPAFDVVHETAIDVDALLESMADLRIPSPPPPPSGSPSFCYIKAKNSDIKSSTGPIQDV